MLHPQANTFNLNRAYRVRGLRRCEKNIHDAIARCQDLGARRRLAERLRRVRGLRRRVAELAGVRAEAA